MRAATITVLMHTCKLHDGNVVTIEHMHTHSKKYNEYVCVCMCVYICVCKSIKVCFL